MTVPSFLLKVEREARLRLWAAEATPVAEATTRWLEAGLLVRSLRGAKMRSTGALMDEVSAALQFPHYFGENWAALDECLADMEWLLPSRGIVLVTRSAELVLDEENVGELEAFVAALTNASNEYGEAVAVGEAWDRPPVPFHVLLQVSPGAAHEAARRWSAAGALLADW